MNSLFYTNNTLFDLFNEFDLSYKDTKFSNTDIKKLNDEILVEMDVPGIKKENLEIKLEKGYLSVYAKVQTAEESDSVKYLYRGKSSRSVNERFYIGDEIDSEKISAELKDGVLFITLGLKEEQKAKSIIVN